MGDGIFRCMGRIRYKTEAQADYACNEYDKNSREDWRGYEHCNRCHGWHLGPTAAQRRRSNDLKRTRHELHCSGVQLRQKRAGKNGIMWFQCSGCEWSFSEMTEGAANLVRKSGSIPVTVR